MKALTRRSLLQTFAAAAGGFAAGCRTRPDLRNVPGEIVGASSKIGHLLRVSAGTPPNRSERTQVAIVGGGIAGLTACLELRKAGVKDVLLFDLEAEVGGNSTYGHNSISGYPWGAHYVPVPNRESVDVIALFEDLGVISGKDEQGRPIYDERYLCHAPEERLFAFGSWQDGIVPQLGATAEDHRQYREFFSVVREFRTAIGADGKPAFAIPIDLSSASEQFRALDKESFAAHLDRRGWRSPYLRWYTNYCCRDDYGTNEVDVSAWAGFHYFASRRAFAANASGHQLLTWPEGNGWIVRRLKERLAGSIRTNALVCAISEEGTAESAARDTLMHLRVLTPSTGQITEVLADAVVYAAPRFTAPYVMPALREQAPGALSVPSYSPWMVANLTVRGYPLVADLAWDNVSYHSDSLGYIVATHQELRRAGANTVLTYYWPLTVEEPDAERKKALARSHADWCRMILEDLTRSDADLARHVTRIDVWIWGHAMARPLPGRVWGQERQEMYKPFGRVFFAHSDMSGCSIFEEAQARGIIAARQVREALSV